MPEKFFATRPQGFRYVQWTGSNFSEMETFVTVFSTPANTYSAVDNLDGTMTIDSTHEFIDPVVIQQNHWLSGPYAGQSEGSILMTRQEVPAASGISYTITED